MFQRNEALGTKWLVGGSIQDSRNSWKDAKKTSVGTFMPEQSSLVVTQQAHGKRAGLGASQLPISSLG